MMAKMNISSLVQWRTKLKQAVSQEEQNAFFEACCKELAARFLRKVVKRTPVGKGEFEVERDKSGQVKKYKRGKKKGELKLKRLTNGGTLRRGWTAKSFEEAKKGGSANMTEYANTLSIQKAGLIYRIFVTNVVPYASFVESGHRQEPGRFVPVLGKRLKNGWVQGVFMAKISESELREEAPSILGKRYQAFLKEKVLSDG